MDRDKEIVERIGLSIEEAAETVGLSRATFLKLVYAGDIPSKTIGRRRLIPTAGLRAWMHAGMDIAPVPVSEISGEEYISNWVTECPTTAKQAIDQFVAQGYKLSSMQGHFISAILENDLDNAVAHADLEHITKLAEIVHYCWHVGALPLRHQEQNRRMGVRSAG